MKEDFIREKIHQAVDLRAAHLQPDPFLAQRIMASERNKKNMIKKIPVGLIVALVLLSLMATALAAALLSPKEVVEQMAVPMAQSSKQENYTHKELEELIKTLNENGITLDEGSTIMQALQAGHGFWEQDTIEEICRAAFGRDQLLWTLEEKHWYGEMMVSIGVWKQNYWLVPDDGEITSDEARALAAKVIRENYQVELPLKNDDNWLITETFELNWDEETNSFPREQARFTVWYWKQSTGNVDYSVSFDRFGNDPEPFRAEYLSEIAGSSIIEIHDKLIERDGTFTKWSVETWAEFGSLIQDMQPQSKTEWLYQHAGYRMPPANAISPQSALKIARDETGAKGSIQDFVLCCQDQGKPIYKVCQSIRFESSETKGKWDAIWCLELDCVTGEVLNKLEYNYQLEKYMMMYVPFSILEDAPKFEKSQSQSALEEKVIARYEKEEKAREQYGELHYFWPIEVQAEIFGEPVSVPKEKEYEWALQFALQSILDVYGPDALSSLGDYKTGFSLLCFEDDENAVRQLNWDFMITTDPVFLSDGYRVQFIQIIPCGEEEETVRDLLVEHANLGNG